MWVKHYGESSYTFSNDLGCTNNEGDVYINNFGEISINTPTYVTFVYTSYDLEKSEEYKKNYYDETMITNNVDKIEYYLNGNLFFTTYYGSDSYKKGLSIWNNDICPFFIGVATIGGSDNPSYLQGQIYSTRLYTKPMTSDQVKANYDMTLKYRSSF